MVVNILDSHIEYLIGLNDCVVVPGFGAILAEYVPASVNEADSTVCPPSRRLSFNAGIDHNDGMLAMSLCRQRGMSYQSAVGFIADEVNALRHRLESVGEVAIGHVGTFTLDRSGNPEFHPGDSTLLGYTSTWLKPVALVPVAAERPGRAVAPTAVAGKPDAGSAIARWSRVAASVAAVVAMGFIFSTPVSVDNAQYASLGPDRIGTNAQAAQSESIIRRPGTSEAPVVLVISRNADSSTTLTEADTAARADYQRARRQAAAAPAADAAKKPAPVSIDGDYCLVVASLASLDEARSFIDSHDGKYDVLCHDGRYRVYAAAGPSVAAVKSMARHAGLYDRHPGAWITRR